MGRPQEQELQRSGNTPLDPDHVAAQAAHHPPAPVDEPHGGPVPADNQPGHHPDHEQDKPDLDAFAEKLGIEPEHDEQPDTDSDEGAGPIGTVLAAASSAREMASSAKEMAEPVAHLVQDTVVRATKAFEERRHLAERVDRLESELAELRARLDAMER